MKNIIIFDLDGTLANIDHRRHLVKKDGDTDWDKFYRECVNDTPNESVIKMFQLFKEAGYTMVIFSGRSEVVRKESYQWLRKHGVHPDIFMMREDGDYTEDHLLKEKWLSIMNKSEIICVVDDRSRVVDMWRDKGLSCFQVDKGDF